MSARYTLGALSLVACHSAPNPPPATVAVRPPETSGSSSSATVPATTTSPTPTAAKGVKILDVDIQTTHACALTQQRALRCWGNNKQGQLGYGDKRSRLAAEVVDVPLPGPVDSFAVDPGSTCAVVHGVAYCWGSVLAGQGSIAIGDDEPVLPAGRVSFDKPVRSIAQGRNFACLLDVEGDVTCWGARDRGELGACPKSGCRASARQPNEMSPVSLGFKASAISLGADHGCAVGPAGNVRCWGFAGDGKLGYISPNRPRPAEVGDLPIAGKVVQVAAALHGTSALLQDGKVTEWGDFSEARERPVAETFGFEPLIKRALQVSRGNVASCAVLEGGAVQCWSNVHQQPEFIGYGKSWTAESVAIDLPGPARLVSVSKLENRMCAVLMGGELFCWGEASPDKVLGYAREDAIGDDETPREAGPVPFAP